MTIYDLDKRLKFNSPKLFSVQNLCFYTRSIILRVLNAILVVIRVFNALLRYRQNLTNLFIRKIIVFITLQGRSKSFLGGGIGVVLYISIKCFAAEFLNQKIIVNYFKFSKGFAKSFLILTE